MDLTIFDPVLFSRGNFFFKSSIAFDVSVVFLIVSVYFKSSDNISLYKPKVLNHPEQWFKKFEGVSEVAIWYDFHFPAKYVPSDLLSQAAHVIAYFILDVNLTQF